MTTVTLTRAQLADIIGVTVKQVRWVDAELSGPRTPEQVRRLQVAARLAEEAPAHSAPHSSTAFPAMARAVLETADGPKPPCWVIYKDGGVCYVTYPADLARFIGSGGVVAQIDKLWTEGP